MIRVGTCVHTIFLCTLFETRAKTNCPRINTPSFHVICCFISTTPRYPSHLPKGSPASHRYFYLQLPSTCVLLIIFSSTFRVIGMLAYAMTFSDRCPASHDFSRRSIFHSQLKHHILFIHIVGHRIFCMLAFNPPWSSQSPQ